MSEERRKRVRLACEPCRRKKARCPGEQPVCSHCARLRQQCTYVPDRRRSWRIPESPANDAESVGSASQADVPLVVDDRLGHLEAQMTQVLRELRQNDRRYNHQAALSSTRQAISSTPQVSREAYRQTPLPPWENVMEIAEVYLDYCDCQPLPLFHRASFLTSLRQRDPEVVYAVIALAIRFYDNGSLDDPDTYNAMSDNITRYTEAARALVIKRVLEGPVELSTLQCLCILCMIDFSNGNTQHATIYSSIAMNLARCANLVAEPVHLPDQVAREERRRCFWSICLLRRLHGEEFHLLDFTSKENLLNPPESTGVPPDISDFDISATEARNIRGMKDDGIVASVLLISETFSRTAGYIKRRGKPNDLLPWSPESEYSKIISIQMEGETRMPYTHRFKFAKLVEKSPEDLQKNRDYWGPWFLNQFLYHTILCLLNHPLLLSLNLKNFHRMIPEIFLQHSSDMVASHTNWIIYFIRYFDEKAFCVSDPFLGYCAAVVATIELQLSFTEDSETRRSKQERFEDCVKFVRGLGLHWPHMAQLAGKLEALKGAVSASYVPYAQSKNKSLLIDLSRFWEILDYSSGFSDAAERLFGPSLFTGQPTWMPEVSNTSPLPEPTRIETSQKTPLQTPETNILVPDASQPRDTASLSQPLDIGNDQFSILAENFFSQGQDFLRGGEDWFTTGNL